MARKKENRVQTHYRVDVTTPAKLNQLAIDFGYTYGTGGAVGEFLDAIAFGVLIVKSKDKAKSKKLS